MQFTIIGLVILILFVTNIFTNILTVADSWAFKIFAEIAIWMGNSNSAAMTVFWIFMIGWDIVQMMKYKETANYSKPLVNYVERIKAAVTQW